jgi:Zn-dependent protease with chaperone function
VSATPARGLAAAIMCLLLSACATGGGGGNKVRDVWLPVSQDEWKAAAVKGATLYRSDKSASRTVPANVIARLLRVKERLELAGSARAELALVDSEQPNAFAFNFAERQVIAFTLPWLDKLGQDPDAIAAVMGHELAHVQLGHSAAERRKREKSARETGQVAGVLLSIIGVPFGGTLAGTAASAYARSFTRDEERAADALGLQWARAAGYDPCGMQRVMKMYAGLDRETPHPWLSTHPGHEERAEYAASVARQAGGRECR